MTAQSLPAKAGRVRELERGREGRGRALGFWNPPISLSFSGGSQTTQRIAATHCKDIVELRIFAGLTDVEIADALQISLRTVKRDWQVGKAILRHAPRPGSQ